jgi:hypothetical protein
MEAMKARIEARVTELEKFRRTWVSARRLQEQGKRDLPVAFERRLRAHYAEALAAFPGGALQSAEQLLAAARVGVFVAEVNFSKRAAETETLVKAITESTAAELRVVEARLSEERRKRREEIRALLDDKMRSIDPRLMLTSRGKKLFEQLMTLRSLEFETAIATALPEMKQELAASPPLVAEVAEAEVVTPRGALRMGRGLGPVTREEPVSSAPAAPAAPPEARPPAPTLRFSRTSREPRPPAAPSGAPPRDPDPTDEPM